MARKSRSQRRRKGVGENSGTTSTDDADFLSESHTIVSLNTILTNSEDGGFSIDDDLDFDEGQHEDNAVRAAEIRQQKLADALVTTDEYLSEKRSAKRESILRSWFRALSQYATDETSYALVEAKLSEIVRGCQFSVRSGTPSEQYAACRVLEVTAILMADESYFEKIYENMLLRILRSNSRAVPVRIAALRAIGMTVFIGVDDEVITKQVMDLCEEVAKEEYRGEKVPTSLREAALRVWCLLATTLHELYISGKDDVSTGRGLILLPLLLECLEQQEDLSLQSAAGECVAWIHTARLQLGEDDGDATERRYQLGSWEGQDWEDIMSEIEQQMEVLSNQAGHYLSKKTKKKTREVFRELLSTIQENEPPLEVIQFRGGSLELNSWQDIIALNFVRRALQSGMQIQLLTNPTLQVIFGANGQTLASNLGYSKVEKRLFLSKTSEVAKAKYLDRTKKRRNRANVKNLFLTSDD